MKKRTRSRELALQFLYQLDLRGEEIFADAKAFVRSEESDRTTADFALVLIQGTWEERKRVDEVIQSVAQNWDIDRMAVIDRNVLRLASYELLYLPDIPPKVSINEAIELGKRYSTQKTGGFINGILDKVKDRYGAAPSVKAKEAEGGVASPDQGGEGVAAPKD